MLKSNDPMSKSELRKFGLLTAGMLVLFLDILIPLLWGVAMPLWPVFAAAVLAFLALLLPAWLGPFYTIWMRFAEALGWVNTRILLSVIFFLIFFPFGLLLRIFNDPMRRKLDEAASSYRVTSNTPKPENMERPF